MGENRALRQVFQKLHMCSFGSMGFATWYWVREIWNKQTFNGDYNEMQGNEIIRNWEMILKNRNWEME